MSSQVKVCPHGLGNFSSAACDVAPTLKFVVQSFPGRTILAWPSQMGYCAHGPEGFSSQSSGQAIPRQHWYCGQSFLGHAIYACILQIKAHQRAWGLFLFTRFEVFNSLRHWICRPETFLARNLCVGVTDRVVTRWANRICFPRWSCSYLTWALHSRFEIHSWAFAQWARVFLRFKRIKFDTDMKLVVQSFLCLAIQQVFHRRIFAISARDFLFMQFNRVQAIQVHGYALGGNFFTG